MFGTVYIPNGIAIILLLVLFFSGAKFSKHMLLLDDKIFYLMVLCNLLQCIGEITAYSIDGKPSAFFRIMALAVNSALFIFNIIFAYLWVIYSDYKIYECMNRIKKKSRFLIIPACLIIFGSLINLFFPVFFSITADNHYQRTNLFIFPYIVTYFYLAYGTIFIYRHKSQARKYVFLPAIIFMLPIFVGSALQFFFYGVSTVWVGVAIALVSVYVNLQNEVSYIDALSGIYTRLYMYQYLEMALTNKLFSKKIAGIMLDIDDFKKINDTYGHLTGDDAIRSVGKILLSALKNRGIAARYGGDEFIILLQIENEDEIHDMLRQITMDEALFNQTKGKNYELHFSKGYGVLDSSDTIDSFLEKIDAAMYEDKKARKQSRQADQEHVTGPRNVLK